MTVPGDRQGGRWELPVPWRRHQWRWSPDGPSRCLCCGDAWWASAAGTPGLRRALGEPCPAREDAPPPAVPVPEPETAGQQCLWPFLALLARDPAALLKAQEFAWFTR